jgi:ribose transport system ATP-binding protein
MGHTIVEVKNIYKEFGATKALTNVSLEIKSGEICGLIGENGSGKSTLSSIIAGIQPPTQGEMLNEGVYYAPTSPIEAQQKGIAMIVQEAGTIPNISITDNIYTGKEQYYLKGIFINKKKMTIDAKKALEKIGITNFDPRASLNTLSQEDRKIIEIARAMDEDPKLLIVDETTTALSLHGREVLYKIMEKMRDEDKSVIFISHDIDEVLAICDSVVILRDGQIVGKLSKEEMNPNIIRKMMVGREIRGDYYRGDFDRTISDQVVLEGPTYYY